MLKRKTEANLIKKIDFSTIRFQIANTQKLIIEESNKFKESHKFIQITNIVSVGMFIIIIIIKVVIARSS